MFQALPFELQILLLKTTHYFTQVAKCYNLRQLWLNEFGNLPITLKEFFRYENQYNPKDYVIFTHTNRNFTIKQKHCRAYFFEINESISYSELSYFDYEGQAKDKDNFNSLLTNMNNFYQKIF